MFLQRFRNFAAQGKANEVRAVLEESVRERHADGLRAALTVVVFGDTPCFNSLVWHEDLAAFQAFREKNLGDPVRIARNQRLSLLMRQPTINELYEVVVTPGPGSPVRFAMNTTLSAAPGKGPGARAACTAYANARNTAGARLRVMASVSGPARLVLTSIFRSMAELEAHRTASAASPEFAALFSPTPPLFAAPGNAEIVEILLQNP